jgi:dienelactone hydrolase
MTSRATRGMHRRRLFHSITPSTPVARKEPSLAFTGTTRAAFVAWQKQLQRELHAALGPEPTRVPLRPQIVARHVFADHVREKVVFDVEKDLAVAAWLCRPRAASKHLRPAVLCLHGNGPGKDPLIGLWQGAICLEYHKRVGVRLAQAGLVTLIPDRRGHGECSASPNGFPPPTDLQDLDAFYQRTRQASVLALDIRDALCAVEFLRTLRDVDSTRLGCLGVEAGGPVAAAAAALCPAPLALYLSLCLDDALRFVGPVQLPRWLGRAGLVELCGLVCPNPLGVQMVEDDSPVRLTAARRAARRIARMYRLAGQAANFVPRAYEGFYEIDYPLMADWFQQRLGARR